MSLSKTNANPLAAFAPATLFARWRCFPLDAFFRTVTENPFGPITRFGFASRLFDYYLSRYKKIHVTIQAIYPTVCNSFFPVMTGLS
jgi:hypothetical protein